ncbi:MAG TPA: hypothetical protein DCE33_14365, partial [Rhodospirillaceae bacterium]|nr:hypothetical protein [Rhodospirillaceae bacterium]
YNMSVLVAPGNKSCQATFQAMPDIKYEPYGQDSADELGDAVDSLLFGNVEEELDLTFVDIGDLNELGVDVEALTDRVEESLRESAYEGTVTRIDDSKYTVIHDTEITSELIESGMTEATQDMIPGGTGLNVETATVGLSDENIEREQLADTMRYAVDQFKENGVSAVQQDSLANMQQAAQDQRSVDIGELEAAAKDNRLTFQFCPVFHLGSGRAEHIQVEPALINDQVNLDPFKVEGYVAADNKLGLLVDTAMAKHLGDYAAGNIPEGAYLSSTFPVKSLTKKEVVGSLMAIAKARPILRIHGMDQDLLQRATELQTLRSAGFLVCLHGYEVGAVNEDKLKTLPMDFVSMDSQLTGDTRTFASRVPILQQMAEICAKYHIRMLFQEIRDPAIIPMLTQIQGSLATGPLFGAPASSAAEAASATMPA